MYGPRVCEYDLERKHLVLGFLFLLFASQLVGCKGESGSPGSITSSSTTSSTQQPGPTYYVDCSAPANGNGTQTSPWNTLDSANAVSFAAGNQLLIKRGTTCQGALNPAGSGSSGAPIAVDAYGTGAAPVIDGGTSSVVIHLMDQQYWEIRNLEIVGGNKFGIFIEGSTSNSALNHFQLINLNVHGAHYVSTGTGDSGEVVIRPTGAHQIVNDVLIDGVTAHDSQVYAGILVGAAGGFNAETAACQQQPTPAQQLGSNITVQNSTVHDVYGSGMVINGLNNGLMQNNVVYNSGLCTDYDCGTGLWEWCCHSCIIQNNESYSNHTALLYDGGDFDIDHANIANILQYNYGHDSDGYCINIGAGYVSTNSIVRYNVCSNNGRNGKIQPQGEVLVGSSVSGVQVYNNTISANPAISSAAFLTQAPPSTDQRIFENNIIYNAVPQMIQTVPGYTLDYNIYWTTNPSSPAWLWNGTTYNSLSAYQSASGQDGHSLFIDPMLNNPTYHSPGRPASPFTLQAGSPARGAGTNVCLGISGCSVGTQDFFGNPLPMTGTGYDIGADQAP